MVLSRKKYTNVTDATGRCYLLPICKYLLSAKLQVREIHDDDFFLIITQHRLTLKSNLGKFNRGMFITPVLFSNVKKIVKENYF